MQDEVKLIYFYQLGAEGFRSGDRMDHPDYLDIIIKATKDTDGEYLAQYKHQRITPQLMSKFVLNLLCRGCSI